VFDLEVPTLVIGGMHDMAPMSGLVDGLDELVPDTYKVSSGPVASVTLNSASAQ